MQLGSPIIRGSMSSSYIPPITQVMLLATTFANASAYIFYACCLQHLKRIGQHIFAHFQLIFFQLTIHR